MAKFQFDLVSPAKLLFSGEVDQVDVPGSEGDFGVLAGHAPLIATLRPGVLVIGGALRVVVNGGFAEVTPSGLIVLADFAVPVEDFDKDWLTAEIGKIQEDAAKTPDGPTHDKLVLRIDQLKQLQATLSQ
jgi:F-type H+-transporting ATPase subunit epsilon